MEGRMSSLYLERIKITSFGSFTNQIIGPFSPRLNVVYGKNETGKTSISAFTKGILFGWEEARGSRNTYKPSSGQREGSLYFVDEISKEEFELSRTKNSEGIKGAAEIIADIDKDTFSTMFSLTSDELRSLQNTSEMTAKLLTAGSGTSSSPTHALNELHNTIAGYTSRAAENEHSLVLIKQKQEELKAEIKLAGDEAERFMQQDIEFHELAPQREEVLSRLEALNSEIESLVGSKAQLDKLELQIDKDTRQREALLNEEKKLHIQSDEYERGNRPSQLNLSASEEALVRERIENYGEEQGKYEHRVDLAKDNYSTSKAAYEALLEADGLQEDEARGRRQRQAQISLSVVLPLLFIFFGVPLFIHGREINSLSFTALGLLLVVFAVVLAAAATVMLFKPNKDVEESSQRKKDAQWVMLQDKKKFESCEEDLLGLEYRVSDYLNSVGLSEAQGSLRQARALLDEMKDAQAQSNLLTQQQQALTAQMASVEDSLSEALAQKNRFVTDLALDEHDVISAIEEIIRQKMQQRTTLTETSGTINRRYGELKQELSQAKNMRRFDELKQAYQEVCTRQRESYREYARLLLAKRALETAISAWESKSQPEVYKQASRLLSLMTEGKWVQVKMSPEGQLQVIDKVKTVREPLLLSLGTCQQLYLSLRIALLMTAENVGRAIPILADDILVNFDTERRIGAIHAIRELAEKRQVILFTCHEEVVTLIKETDRKVEVLPL